MKKDKAQYYLEARCFEVYNLVIFKRQNIKIAHLAGKPEQKMYDPYKIPDIIYLIGGQLGLLKMKTTRSVFLVSILELFVKGNQDVDLNSGLQT
jgi:hypothetical protein